MLFSTFSVEAAPSLGNPFEGNALKNPNWNILADRIKLLYTLYEEKRGRFSSPIKIGGFQTEKI